MQENLEKTTSGGLAHKSESSRTFSLSQMTKAKLVSALAWREKVHENERLFSANR